MREPIGTWTDTGLIGAMHRDEPGGIRGDWVYAQDAEDALNAKDAAIADLLEYVEHGSWRCAYYSECHCGLNALTDKLGIARVPVPERLP